MIFLIFPHQLQPPSWPRGTTVLWSQNKLSWIQSFSKQSHMW